MRTTISALILFAIAACKDSTSPGRRGDPFTIVVTHVQFHDTLAQHYDWAIVVDEAGPTPPQRANQGGIDSIQVALGYNQCTSLGTDSLGARIIWGEFVSSFPSPAGDTVRGLAFDPANIPSADSANGYGQTQDKPYLWHWYISNDSNVVRGDTTPYVQPTQGGVCTY